MHPHQYPLELTQKNKVEWREWSSFFLLTSSCSFFQTRSLLANVLHNNVCVCVCVWWWRRRDSAMQDKEKATIRRRWKRKERSASDYMIIWYIYIYI